MLVLACALCFLSHTLRLYNAQCRPIGRSVVPFFCNFSVFGLTAVTISVTAPALPHITGVAVDLALFLNPNGPPVQERQQLRPQRMVGIVGIVGLKEKGNARRN